MISNTYNVVMFAHNEGKNITQSVKSLFNNCDDRMSKCLILAKGCTDNTVEILENFGQEHYNQLKVIELLLGDECNAWNTYAHDLADSVKVHFFIDADVAFTENAFPIMFDTLTSSGTAMGIACLPSSERNIEYYCSLAIDRSCLFGNCY